jgi:hypothetical protein
MEGRLLSLHLQKHPPGPLTGLECYLKLPVGGEASPFRSVIIRSVHLLLLFLLLRAALQLEAKPIPLEADCMKF